MQLARPVQWQWVLLQEVAAAVVLICYPKLFNMSMFQTFDFILL